jgi:hypothetical protein
MTCASIAPPATPKILSKLIYLLRLISMPLTMLNRAAVP